MIKRNGPKIKRQKYNTGAAKRPTCSLREIAIDLGMTSPRISVNTRGIPTLSPQLISLPNIDETKFCTAMFTATLIIKIVTNKSLGRSSRFAISLTLRECACRKERIFIGEIENNAVSEAEKKAEIARQRDKPIMRKVSSNEDMATLSLLKNDFFLPFWHEPQSTHQCLLNP